MTIYKYWCLYSIVDTNSDKIIMFEGVMVMVFNATFNNILVLLWRSALLVEETGVSEENHCPVANLWQTLSIIMFE
jgi:hypothetical protein